MIIIFGFSGTEVMITVINDPPLFKILLKFQVILSPNEIREKQVKSKILVNN